MPEKPNRRLVPRRRHKNVIEAPIPHGIVGDILERIEVKLRNVWRVTFVLELMVGIFMIHTFSTSDDFNAGIRFFGILLTAVYCVVLLFNRMQRTNPTKLSSVFSTLWLAAACTPVAYSGQPEVPIVIASVLCIGYSLLGDRSLMRQMSGVLVLLSVLWLATNWGSPDRSQDDLTTIKLSLLLAGVVAITTFIASQIAKVQASRIFGDSIKGLEGMQRALAEQHNRRIAESQRERPSEDASESSDDR